MNRIFLPRYEQITMPDAVNVDRLVAIARIALAALSLALIVVDSREPDHRCFPVHLILVLYIGYGAILYGFACRQSVWFPELHRRAHWVDIAWTMLIIASTNGTGIPYIKGFYFPITVAALRLGFAAGLGATLVSIALLSLLGPLAHSELEFAQNMFLNRSANVLVLGFLIAYTGGIINKLRGRLMLLKDLTALSNPRLGADHVIGSAMERVRVFFGGQDCVLIAHSRSTGRHYLRRARPLGSAVAPPAEVIAAELGERLTEMPVDKLVLYNAASSGWWPWPANCLVINPVTGQESEGDRAACEQAAARLDAASFLCAPFDWRDDTDGWLYLSAPHRLKRADVELLLQAIRQIQPLIQYVRLMDRLTSGAAEEERRRIARDIHDSVIQPYIGLQFGLTALHTKLAQGRPEMLPEVREDAQQLLKLTATGIGDLRRYVSALREGAGREAEFLPAVRRFAATFSEVTGIEVRVEAESEIRIGNRLAGDAFQIVEEGLSNIRRHTRASQAAIMLSHSSDRFRIVIENEGENRTVYAVSAALD
jgi:signal transduction histidine kinase